MPSTSKAQQRLMGQAYALKKGDIKLKDIDAEYRDEIKELADSMTLKSLKSFAKTKHEGLPERVPENLGLGDMSGMGPVKLPTATELGSGDVPAGQGDAEEEYKKKRRKMKHLKTFESFIFEAKDSIIGVLTNSMEYYDEDSFMQAHKEFGYDEEAMKEIFNDYWSLDAKKRMDFNDTDWKKWLKSYNWGKY